MAFIFRFPFDLAETQRVGIPATAIMVSDSNGHQIYLRSGTELPISQVGRLEMRGLGYATAAEAAQDGKRWMSALAFGLLQFNLAPDFRTRTVPFSFTEDGLRSAAQLLDAEPGQLVAPDTPGLTVHDSTTVPDRFIRSFIANLSVGGFEDTPEAIRAAYEQAVEPDDATFVAIDMLSSYYRMPSTDAQFLSLVMAMEALIVPRALNQETVSALSVAARSLRDLELPPEVRDSLAGRIRNLGEESIGQAGKRVARGLGDRRYGGRDAPSFFTYCYGMRSKIVHGSIDRPEPAKLHATTAQLLTFVRDLIELQVLRRPS